MHVFITPIQTFLSCQVCQGLEFAQREIKMTTTGMTFFDLDWANKSADGVVCVRCGFVHTFMGEAHEWIDPSRVDAADLPADPHATPPLPGEPSSTV
jgi:predicted nucleic-acid-binding Zn-ribbon protein